MSDALRQFRESLRLHNPGKAQNLPLPGLSIYHCHQLQRIRAVPMLQPMLMLVVAGQKEITLDERQFLVGAGELFITPSDQTLLIRNTPDARTQDYRAVALGFTSPVISHFRQIHGPTLKSAHATAQWHAKAPHALVDALHQWYRFCVAHPPDPALIQHRQVEILLLLAQAGLAGNLLFQSDRSWRQRVSQLITLQPARPWQIAEIGQQLGLSESSLRRRLQEEGCRFREILEEARLAVGLHLLLESFQPIGEVSDAVGYQSQSRFGERFKKRFGLTPSALRRTRMRDSGETLAVSGE